VYRPESPSVAATLRDVNNAAFLHRERARFRAGTSELLGVVCEPALGDGVIIDVAGVAELRRIDVANSGAVTIGAFAAFEEVAGALPALCPADASVVDLRTRLALYDARVTVYGVGRTRVVPVETFSAAPYEIPVTIDVPPIRAGLGVAQRRRTTRDGDASFTLGVTVALRVSMLARFENVRIVLDIDGTRCRAGEAEAMLERARCDRDLFAGAARSAATVLRAVDARTSAAARSLQPLVLACLRDAFASARPSTK
jgi:CO/xanthine dehydrogenase FAD-binding subunit